jgi:isocitrate dehydrogenase kinase/phosphatase
MASHSVDYGRLIAGPLSDHERIALTAEWIWAAYDEFYESFVRITWSAKAAFEASDHAGAVRNAKTRLGLYDATVRQLAQDLAAAFPELQQNEPVWARVEAAFIPRVEADYEFDLALAYLHSVRRRLYRGEWRPVEYQFAHNGTRARVDDGVHQRFACQWPVGAETIKALLQVANLSLPFEDLDGDAQRVATRLNERLAHSAGAELSGIEMLLAGFFRNRGAYLVGRMAVARGRHRPFVLALLNVAGRLRVDALLDTPATVHNLFSSTEAPFHVTNRYYHELCDFLFSIMPKRPLGLHYSAIGFYHVGKVAVMNEIRQHLVTGGETASTAPGARGTVAIAFTSRHCDYVMKVIRDKPTDGYKWDTFLGPEAVLAKYRRVHDINRTGSMLDNIVYNNLRLNRSWLDPELVDELLAHATNAVRLQNDWLIFSYLVVQRKLTPLNLFLESAPADRAARAIVNLGYCIKSNAAANIFNRDFDARNYGVSRYLKVYLYDYDSIETLTDVKVRTNTDRLDGEEDVPGWYFEDGVVFLPEEIESGLRVHDRALRRAFRSAHPDLMTVAYWENMQRLHEAGVVPGIQTFPESCRIWEAHDREIANE